MSESVNDQLLAKIKELEELQQTFEELSTTSVDQR